MGRKPDDIYPKKFFQNIFGNPVSFVLQGIGGLTPASPQEKKMEGEEIKKASYYGCVSGII